MSKSNYDRKIILKPKGGGRTEARLGDLQIPDLWHFADQVRIAFDRLAAAHELVDWMIDTNDLEYDASTRKKLTQLLMTLRDGKPPKNVKDRAGENARQKILDIWNLTNDLKLNLADDVNPR